MRRSPVARTLAPAVLTAALALAWAADAPAQPYAKFAVPDSLRARALAASRADFESAWNALLVASLRARLARADSTRRLEQLVRDVAQAEPAVLGSHIGVDALALAKHWNDAQRRLRVQAAVAESLALVARNARAFDRADSLLGAARDAYRRLGEKRREAWVLGSRGANLLIAGRNPEAAAAYDVALEARRALGDSTLLGNTLSDLGQTYVLLLRYDDAARVLREACAIRAAQHRATPLAKSLNFLGLAYSGLARPDSATACYRRAMVLSSTAGDSATTLVVLANATAVLMEQGALDEATRTGGRALALATTLGDAGTAARIENNLGLVARGAGHYGQSLEHFDRAAAGFESLGDVDQLALALAHRAVTMVWMGSLDAARPVLNRAAALADSMTDRGLEAQVLSTVALGAEQLDDRTRADALARRGFAAAVAAGDSAAVHDAAALLGYLAHQRGDEAAAEPWYARAVSAGANLRPEVRANDLSGLGMAHQLLGRLDEAEREHHAALSLAEAAGAANEAMYTRCNLGDLAERRGDPRGALGWYAGALAIADTVRTLQSAERQSIDVLASRLFMFEAMIHLLGKLDRAYPDSGYAAQAFDWAERSRARAFIDLVAASGASEAPTSGASEATSSGAGAAPASGSGTPERTGAAALVDLRGAQRLLGSKGDALLEYSVGDSSTTLWALRQDRWRRFTLPARPALRSRVQRLRRALADPTAWNSPAALRASHELYAMLVAPAETLLAGADHVIVAPDGPLALIPFEALLTRAVPEGETPRAADYLVSRWAISYTPSASVLATRTARTADSVIVAVGDPDFGTAAANATPAVDAAATGAATGATPARVTLEPLPSTRAEVDALRALAGKRRMVTLTGAAASRERLLALPELERAGLLHIATHGNVDEAEPGHSGLWLSPDSSGAAPSRLEVADIMRLRLSAGLVTLSACETGLGRLENGEGVVGLSRALMVAGAQSVLVSLWSVNDRSTATLMSAFYRKALGGRVSPVTALAAAKRTLLATPETSAPFYWAPFVLLGRAGSIGGP